jgi:hypothetical protein
MSMKDVCTSFPEDDDNSNTKSTPERSSEANGKSPKVSDREGTGPSGAGPDRTRKTTSRRQIEANRINARNSTGPRTEAGKRKSSRNSLKHGVLAKKILFNDDGMVENKDLHDYYDRLCEEYPCYSVYEEFLRDDLLLAFHGCMRTIQLERLAAKYPGYMYNVLPKLQRYHTAHRNALLQDFNELNEVRRANASWEQAEIMEGYEPERFDTSIQGDDMEEEADDEEPLPWANGLTMAEYLDYAAACNMNDMLLGPEDPGFPDWDDDDNGRGACEEADVTAPQVPTPSAEEGHDGMETSGISSRAAEAEERFIDLSVPDDIAPLVSGEVINGSTMQATEDADVATHLQPDPNPGQPILPIETAEAMNDECKYPTLLRDAVEETPSVIPRQQQPLSDRGPEPSRNCRPPSSAELLDSLSHIVAVDDDEGGSGAESL